MLTKTLNVPSTMVAARKKSSEVVLSAIGSHGQEMADFMGGKYSPHLEEGQVMPFATQLQLFEKELIRLTQQLRQAERRNRTQKARESKARTRRDAHVQEVNTKVARVRRTVSGVFNDGEMVEIGLSRRNARDSEVLLEQAASLVVNLERPDLELSAEQLGGVDVDASVLAQDIKPCADKLQQSLTELRREQRQTEATLFAKNEAMDEFNHGFLWIARSVESLLQLAGLPEQAGRVRPSSRRPGVTERLETSDTDGDEPSADGDTPSADGNPPAAQDGSDQPASEDPSSETGTVTEP